MVNKFYDDSHSTRISRGFTDPVQQPGFIELGNTGLLVPRDESALMATFVKGWRTDLVRSALRSNDYIDVAKDYITSPRFVAHCSELTEEQIAWVYREMSDVVKTLVSKSGGSQVNENKSGFGARRRRDRHARLMSQYEAGSQVGTPNSPQGSLLDPHMFEESIYGFKDLEKLIDRCMSDAPQHQHKDSKHFRVFTAKNALKLAKDYDSSKDHKDTIEEFIRDMATNNGYRQRITATESRRKKLTALLDSYPNFRKVTQHLLDQMDSWALRQPKRRCFEPILLNGPKGCGKTSYAKSLAQALHTDYEFVNIASVSMGGVLVGTSEKWSNAQPGLLFKSLSRGESASPLILLDEIDKVQDLESKYPIGPVLLAMLEPETSSELRDEFSLIEFDASQIFYVATCNDASLISPPIRSRFKTFNVIYPNVAQRRTIIARRLKADYRNVELSEKALVLLSRQMGDLRHLRDLIDQLVNHHVQTQLKSMGRGRAQVLKGKQIITEHTAMQVLTKRGGASRLFDRVEV
ncbi:MAG: AAA family ATPase [Limnobacter sp.]|uniref:AAA family ATPase n=1 Tax=Limnobacter sp. TaxID=2003368 RepID=UPI00391C864B